MNENNNLLERVNGRMRFLADAGNVKDVELYSSLLSWIGSLTRQLENANYEWREAQANYDASKATKSR
ncbi:hypothetical protein ACMAUW_004993 [Citrobacter farmeri]|uniref:hypothetical protein n=1 Tax=Citrobacter freundii TaxID=546 RepID=UPI000FFE0872|nr:hypothetical protein [Citrobacter freundii]QAT69557.1 hypothetical protein EQ249_08035 [Citrobacter freundii]